MYEKVFPIITGHEIPIEFTEYEAFKKTIRSVKTSFLNADMRSEKMTYSQRIDRIMKLEAAQAMLFNYAKKLGKYFQTLHDHENLRMVYKLVIKLSMYSTIQVGVNTYGDWVINTPLLGLSHNNISYIVHESVDFAILALKAGGTPIPQIKKGCVLVKTYGNIAKMAHCTLENREVHAITDAFMKVNNTDDHPENFNFMYSWGYSDTPGVQIIICTTDRAHLYKSLMFDFGNPEELPFESIGSRKRRAQVTNAFNTLEDIFTKYPRIAVDPILITTKQIDCLASILRRLTTINTALRNPSIFPQNHKSDYYTRGSEPKENQYKAVFDPEGFGEFEFDKATASIIAYCHKIDSCYNRGGKILQDFLECGFWQYADWYSPDILAAVKDNPPMAITVERCLTGEDEVDGDNINILGASYEIFNDKGKAYDFRDNIMLIKSKIVNHPSLGYDDFPTKIVLGKAENVDMDF